MNDLKLDSIKKEMLNAGVTSNTLINLESKRLISILHPDEHIGGVIHGVYSGGLAWLIATNLRVIFMERKPFFSSFDEISYEVVSGAKSTSTSFNSSLTLHTRVKEYNLNFVKTGTDKKFLKFIENKKIEYSDESNNDKKNEIPENNLIYNDQQIISKHEVEFLKTHNLGVISSIDKNGDIHGTTVNYLIDQSNLLYILTKSSTEIGKDIPTHNKVAITVYDEEKMQTLELEGLVQIVTDQITTDIVLEHATKPRVYAGIKRIPPVTKIKDGTYIVIKIIPTLIKYKNYSN